MKQKETLLSNPAVQDALATCRKAQAKFQAQFEQFEPILNPVEYSKAIQSKLQGATDLNVILELQQRLVSVDKSFQPDMQLTNAAILAQRRAQSICAGAHVEFKRTLPAL